MRVCTSARTGNPTLIYTKDKHSQSFRESNGLINGNRNKRARLLRERKDKKRTNSFTINLRRINSTILFSFSCRFLSFFCQQICSFFAPSSLSRWRRATRWSIHLQQRAATSTQSSIDAVSVERVPIIFFSPLTHTSNLYFWWLLRKMVVPNVGSNSFPSHFILFSPLTFNESWRFFHGHHWHRSSAWRGCVPYSISSGLWLDYCHCVVG